MKKHNNKSPDITFAGMFRAAPKQKLTAVIIGILFSTQINAQNINADNSVINVPSGVFITTDGSVTFQNSGQMDNSGTVMLKGDWTNNGTGLINASAGTVVLNGTAAQTIGGSAVTTFNNLTINNSNGVILAGNIIVNGTLTFTAGTITTGANYVILGSNATVVGAGAGKYVNGNMRRNIPAVSNLSITFDIGDALNYTPATIDFSGTPSGSGSLDASTSIAIPAIASGLSQTQYVNRQWVITNNGVTGFVTYNPTFTFINPGDLVGGPSTSTLIIRKLDGGTWAPTTTGTQNSSSTQCTGEVLLGTPSTFAIGVPSAPPAISCPSNVTVNNTSGICGNTSVTYPSATSISVPAPTITYSQNSGTAFSGGTTTVTVTATNINGTSSCSFDVTVNDNEAPVISCPATANIFVDAMISGTATQVFASGGGTGVSSWAPYTMNFSDPLPAGALITGADLTYTAADQGWGGTGGYSNLYVSGTHIGDGQLFHSASTITLNYTGTIPGYVYGGNNTLDLYFVGYGGWQSFWYGGTLTLHYTIGSCSSTASIGTATATDNCTVASITNNHTGSFPLGNTNVIWTATDASGNTSTCTQVVNVTDNIAPTISAPATVTATTNTGCTATGVSLGTPVTGDNCSVASTTNDAPSVFPLGNTTVTWTVTDGSGNTATAAQTVTVTDNVNPTITAPSDVTVCEGSSIVLGTPVTADNCTVASVTNNAPVSYLVGTTTVVWTVTDGSGNTATANQLVTVNAIPVATATPSSQSICSGATISPIVLTSNIGGEAFTNGGFETGDLSSWVTLGTAPTPVISTSSANTGTYSMLLGTLSGSEPYGDGSIYQTINVPANGGTLSFWYQAYTTDAISWDWQDAYIMDASGNILATIFHQCSNTGWTNVTYNMAAFAGQTVRLEFLVHQDGYGDDTGMYVDDVTMSVPATTTFNWTRDNTVDVTGINASGSGDISGSLSNTTTSSLTSTFTITPVSNSCIGTPVTATITVNPLPDATISASNGLTFCDGTNTVLSVPTPGGTTQVWNQNGVFFATASNPLVTVAATYDVTVTNTASGCTSSSTVTTIVNETPVGSASNIVICNGDPSNVPLNSTEANTTYTWTSSVTTGGVIGNNDCVSGCGNAIADVLTNTGYVHGVVTYTVIPTSGLGCTGAPFTANVTVGAAPAAPVISGPNALCGLTSTIYTITAVPEATSYVWTVPTGVTGMTITGGQGTTTLHVSISAGTVSGDVTCTAYNNCGSSTTTTFAVTKKPAVPGAITGPTSTCGQTTATYSVAPVFGATSYIWTLPPGMTASGASNLNTITVNIAGTFVYGQLKVSAVNACGNIPGTGIWITGNAPTIPLTLSGPSNVCGLTSGTYSIPAVAGATGYNWVITGAGNSISGSNTGTTATAILAGPGTISVAATNLCGSSPYRALTLVTTGVQPGTISGPLNTCGLTTATYSVAPVAYAATYTWSLAYGMTMVNGQGTNVIDVNIAPGLTNNTATSPLKLTETNVCGNTSLFRSTTITRCLSPDALNSEGGNTFSNVYPNPTSSDFTMDVTVDADKAIVLEVYDILGNVVISEKHNLVSGTSTMKTSLEQFNSGIYFVRLIDANSNVLHTERVVKQ